MNTFHRLAPRKPRALLNPVDEDWANRVSVQPSALRLDYKKCSFVEWPGCRPRSLIRCCPWLNQATTPREPELYIRNVQGGMAVYMYHA